MVCSAANRLNFGVSSGQENVPSYWSRCGIHVLAVRGARDYVTYDVDHKLSQPM
jgi:hypothetical protein